MLQNDIQSVQNNPSQVNTVETVVRNAFPVLGKHILPAGRAPEVEGMPAPQHRP